MTPEKRIQNSIINYLKQLEDNGIPIWYDRRQAGGFSYHKGMPDLYAVYNGQHIEIEVKRIGGSLEPLQIKWRDKIIKRGGYYLCADSVDDVKLFFRLHFNL